MAKGFPGFDNRLGRPQSGGVASPSYLLSFVAIQALRLGEKTQERFGGAWLVWEPGAWQPPSPGLMATLGPTGGPPTRPTQTDALCFHLGADGHFRIGRSPENDCVVSDATVSRHHLEVFTRTGHWWARPVNGRIVGLNHRPLTGDMLLSPGDKLLLGDVTLSFEDAAGLLSRAKV